MKIFPAINSDRNTAEKSLTIIGLGNEYLSDDGAGIRVVRELRNRISNRHIVFEELAIGGLQLLDFVVGYKHCIIIDAITSGQCAPGTLFKFIQKPDEEPVSLSSSHQIDLGQVLGLAKFMGAELPETLTVYGVEVSDITTFRDACTEEVSRALPLLVERICNDLNEETTKTPERTGEWHIIDQPVTI